MTWANPRWTKINSYVPFPSSDFHAAGAENAPWSFTNSDFLNSNCSFDDPIENFSNGELQGSDDLPLRRCIVDDVVKERVSYSCAAPVVKVPRVYNDDKLKFNVSLHGRSIKFNVRRSVTDKIKRSNDIDKTKLKRSNDIDKTKLKRSNDIGKPTMNKDKFYVPLPSSNFHAAGAENALWSFTNSDFLNSNCSFDDPIENFSNGELQGTDGLPLRRCIVGDVEKERRWNSIICVIGIFIELFDSYNYLHFHGKLQIFP